MDGFNLALARKLNLNSLASLPKDEIEKGFNQLYHIRTGPYRVVRETQHIKALGMPYRPIWAQKAATCSARSKLREMEARGDRTNGGSDRRVARLFHLETAHLYTKVRVGRRDPDLTPSKLKLVRVGALRTQGSLKG
ncbi:hypothetical protein B296_00004125 [Ensete ventricosum]|uniref:Uncharacterized protein n=1 Tax=Ensete ventricosum TaxID=4639 RepID=A0A427BBX5_ENSVE|nr:hypothetical protein B296_00004125 [Ensete ventricosum]